MTQEEKQLLLKDLCARLPYVDYKENEFEIPHWKITTIYPSTFDGWIGYDRRIGAGSESGSRPFKIEEIKPYLRLMSSMTEEEQQQLKKLICEHLNSGYPEDEWSAWLLYDKTGIKNGIGGETLYFYEIPFIYDWLNAYHFDYRGLIPMGLALEAKEGMYNIK